MESVSPKKRDVFVSLAIHKVFPLCDVPSGTEDKHSIFDQMLSLNAMFLFFTSSYLFTFELVSTIENPKRSMILSRISQDLGIYKTYS